MWSAASCRMITGCMISSWCFLPGRPGRRRAMANLDRGGVPRSGTARGRAPWSATRGTCPDTTRLCQRENGEVCEEPPVFDPAIVSRLAGSMYSLALLPQMFVYEIYCRDDRRRLAGPGYEFSCNLVMVRSG